MTEAPSVTEVMWSDPDFDESSATPSAVKLPLSSVNPLPATVLPDPRSSATPEDYQAQFDFLIQVQDERTGHFGLCSSYGHGIATYALAEYHALTHDARLWAPGAATWRREVLGRTEAPHTVVLTRRADVDLGFGMRQPRAGDLGVKEIHRRI